WSVVLWVWLWLVCVLLPTRVSAAYPTTTSFLPALDGDTPDCVQDPRDTFCLKPKKYPKERIVYLLENKMYDLNSLLMDESRDSYTFEARNVQYQPMMIPRPPLPTTPPNLYQPPPAPLYDNEGPYPRYPKSTPSSSSPNTATTSAAGPPHFVTRYLPPPHPPHPPPRAPPKPQPWWMKIMGNTRHRQRRQSLTTTDLCPYEPDYIMPRAALNNRGTWMYVVNMEEVSSEFTQLVESKKCITDRCSGACNVPLRSSAICQQQYVQKKLMALDTSGNALAMDVFWFPSCCVCKIRPDDG
ncbi:hypothetical protein Pmani_013071, partial [Petrolisthes manimaculis]